MMGKMIIIVLMIITIISMYAFGRSMGACFLVDSYVSGMNRICIYDCISGTKAVTINSCEMCPMTICE